MALETVPEGAAFDDCLVGQELISLRHITAVLREQCPWDKEQRAMDIVSYTIEEVYELAEVIMKGRLDDEHDELGDVLFQVYFLSRLLEEEQAGDLGSVAAEIEAKLIRRHAHIFGDDVAETAERRARRLGARQARRRGPRGRLSQRAEHPAGPAAGAQGAAARRRGGLRLGARPRGLSQDRRGARRARRPVRGPAVGVRRGSCRPGRARAPAATRVRRPALRHRQRGPQGGRRSRDRPARGLRPVRAPGRQRRRARRARGACSGRSSTSKTQDDYYRRAKSGEGGLYRDHQEDTP